MALSVGEIEATLRLRDEMTAGLKTAASAMSGFVADAEKAAGSAAMLGLGIAAVGAVISVAFTLPLIAASKASVGMAMEFETAMVKVETLSGVGAVAVASMSKEVLELATATGVGPQELAKALLVVTSTGMRGKEAMEILTASAKGTAIGLGETADTARAITAAITAYGKENLTAATAANQLFVAVREGGAEATSFANTLGRVFGIAAQLGVGFDEVTASVATFTRLGVNASEAVTALRGTLNVMLHPAKQTQKALAELGTSADELRKSIREKGLAQTLIDLVALAKGNEEAIGHIIPNVRALAGVLGNTGKQAEAYKDILHKIQDETGALGTAMERTSETAGFKWNQMVAEAKVLAIEFGITLLPIVKNLYDVGKVMLDWLNSAIKLFGMLPAPVQVATIAMAGFVAAMGPLLVIAGLAIMMWPAMEAGLVALAPVLAGVTASFGLLLEPLAAVATFLTGPVGIAIAAAIAGMVALRVATGSWSEAFSTLLSPLTYVIDKVIEFADALGITQVLQDIGRIIRDLLIIGFYEMKKSLGETIDAMKIFGRAVLDYLKANIEVAIALGKELVDVFAKALPTGMKLGIAAMIIVADNVLGLGSAMSAGLHKAADALDIMAGQQKKATYSARDLADGAMGVAGQMGKVASESGKAGGKVGELSDEAKKAAKAFETLYGKISGEAATESIKTLDKVYGALITHHKLTEHAIDEVVKQAMRFSQEGGTLTGRLVDLMVAQGAWSTTVSKTALNMKELGTVVAVTVPQVDSYTAAVARLAAMSKTLTLGSITLSGTSSIDVGKPTVPKPLPPKFFQALFQPEAMGQALAGAIVGAFQGGGSALQSAVGQLGSMVMGNLGKHLVGTADAAGPLFNSALGKVFAGALPVIGSLIGPLAGAIWGKLFGTAGRDAVEDFAKKFKGFEGLHAVLGPLGAAGEQLWVKLTQGVGKNNPEQAKKVIAEVEAALAKFAETQARAIAGAATAVSGFNAIAVGFAAPFKSAIAISEDASGSVDKLYETQQRLIAQIADLSEKTSRTHSQENALRKAREDLLAVNYRLAMSTGDWAKSQELLAANLPALQEGFDRMGRLAVVAFGAAIASGKTLIEALAEMGPGLSALDSLMKTFGLTASDTFAELLQFKQFVEDNKEIAASIDGINKMMRGLYDAGMLSQATFTDLTAVAVETFNRIIEGGLSGDQALRMMQPTLQTIWQLQKDFGYVVDEATQALLDEAVAAGLVGEKHKSAMERMVDGINRVADILATVFGNQLPDALKKTSNAVTDIKDGIDKIPRDVDVNVRVNRRDTGGGGGDSPPEYGAGGHVSGAHMAIVGDRPEYITPDSSIPSLAREIIAAGGMRGGGGNYVPVTLEMNGVAFWRALIEVAREEGVV